MDRQKILLIEDLYEEGFTSGTKARQDVRKIVGGDIYYCYLKRKSKLLDYGYSLIRLFAKLSVIQSREKILIQYPFYSDERFNAICYRVLPRKAVLLIHDISSLRYERPESEVQKEIKTINRFHKIIVHNIRMKKWLADQGVPEEKMVMLRMFDYLGEKEPENRQNKKRTGYTLSFAGNLGKSRFLEKLIAEKDGLSLKFELYGIQPSEQITKSGFYRGVESPDRLPDVLEGDLGLVWDGESLEECQEATGRYLEYNCPHKFSLYMAAGMPVVIGKRSAMAEITEKEQLGITVGDLRELQEKLSALSKEEYEKMRENVARIQKRVRQGQYLEDALKKCGLLK